MFTISNKPILQVHTTVNIVWGTLLWYTEHFDNYYYYYNHHCGYKRY